MFLHAAPSVEQHVFPPPTISRGSLSSAVLHTQLFFESSGVPALNAPAFMTARKDLRVENSGSRRNELGNKPVRCISWPRHAYIKMVRE